MAGLSTGNISFGSNFVRVNWQGLSFSTSTVVKLDLTFDPPLDPSQMSVAQTLDGSGSPASNTRTLTVADGTELALAGTIDNSGAIAVNGASAATAIGINGNVTLDGGGQIDLSASNENYIFGNGTLTNIDNTISGSGDLGNGTLSAQPRKRRLHRSARTLCADHRHRLESLCEHRGDGHRRRNADRG